MNLRRCPKLRELGFELYPALPHMTTISSVTSIHIRKITFSSSYTSPTQLHTFVNQPFWVPLDDYISALANKLCKLGSKQPLEVEFLIDLTTGPPADCEGFLPKSREVCPVRIVERSSGVVMELSVRFLLLFASRHLL